jgi:hypothetical protein
MENFLTPSVKMFYRERPKKVDMIKGSILNQAHASQKSPHPPFIKGGQGGISGDVGHIAMSPYFCLSI